MANQIDPTKGRAAQLLHYKGEDEVLTFEQAREISAKDRAPWMLKTGLPSLDHCFSGIAPGELVVVSGPSENGKTTLCQSLTRNLAQEKIYSLWLLYENDRYKFLNKMRDITIEACIPKMMIERTMSWVEDKIIEARAKYGIKAVFIDHLHHLIDLSSVRNTSLVIGGILREIIAISKRQQVVPFVVAHIGKPNITKDGKIRKPCVYDIRDSSFTYQEPRYVFMIWRRCEPGSSADNIKYLDENCLALQKNSDTGKHALINLVMKNGFFVEAADQSQNGVQEIGRSDWDNVWNEEREPGEEG